MAASIVMDEPKGKGKGKGKKPKKTPEEMGFQDVGRRLLTREAKLLHTVPAAVGMEISSLEIGKKGQPVPSGVRSRQAGLEVLCNRQSIFGNPFNMREDESVRDDICDAYVEYIDQVAIPAAGASGSAPSKQHAEIADSSLRSVVERIAAARRFPSTSLSKDWLRDFGSLDIPTFQASFEALTHLCQQHNAVGGISLVCHCIPRRCHCMTLAERVQRSLGSQPQAIGDATSSESARPPPRHRSKRGVCAGVIAMCGSDGNELVCLVEKANGKLGFPKGGAEAQDTSVLETALREWREETNYSSEVLDGLSEDIQVVDSWGIKYFPAVCVVDDKAIEPCQARWRVQDQAEDPDPIVWAQWMSCREALKHPMLSRERKQVLQQAMAILRKSPQPASAAAVDAIDKIDPAGTADAEEAAPRRRRWQKK
mmetsp:Transcript_30315/g.55320  ORF Transcript_30315/g.55320 Transcript_30315/m.55320 type:complete len:425 (-) Transcript_30315:61-1335(-)